jgi:membrane-bound lytic murein transglycosylase B
MDHYTELQEKIRYQSYGFGIVMLIIAGFILFLIGSGIHSCMSRAYTRQEKIQKLKELKARGIITAPAPVSQRVNKAVNGQYCTNPHAKAAAKKYGVPVELIWCIHAKETSCGMSEGNRGKYLAYTRLPFKTPKARKGNQKALKNISQEIGVPYQQIRSNSAMAMGPFQFVPITWWSSAIDGDGDGVRDPFSLADSTFTTAKRLRSARNQKGSWNMAVFTHNHDWGYVGEVMACAGM